MKLSISSNIHDYQVTIEHSPDFFNDLCNIPSRCFIVDENVWTLYKGTFLRNLSEKDVIIQPIKEELKNLDSVQNLYDQLVNRSAKRNWTMISIGGGILQDITGFAASTIYRGMRWIYLPTTLLSQADSCIGSKTSLNYRGYKNLIGTFYPPVQIHIYPPFLNSLKDIDYQSGLGEIIKLFLMGGCEHYRNIIQLMAELQMRDPEALSIAIQEALKIKLSYMEGDEFDTGFRNLLNFGHDFGHALESASHYRIPHGQAVIFGMLAANCIARRRSLLNNSVEEEIADALLIPNLSIPPSIDELDPEMFVQAMQKDKKRTGDALVLIMMMDNFEFFKANDVTPDEIQFALNEVISSLKIK
jgi:3-dehydroquinate synthase